MPQNAKDSCQAITTLKEGILDHHKFPDIRHFSNKDDTYTTSDGESIKVLSKNFHYVYNIDVFIYWSVLEEIKKKPVLN